MGLENVIEKIQKEGTEKVTAIISDAEHQAAQILKTAQQQLKELSKKKKQEVEHYIDTLTIQEASGTDIEVKKIRLNAEKDVLTTTYKDALQALATLPHEKILSSLLTRIQQELPEAATIYTNARDEAFVRSQTQITYDGTIDTLGGIIVENKEKTLQIDYRYETIADIVWDRSLKEIAETLFK